MSRISRYQDSVCKFMKNNQFFLDDDKEFTKIVESSDHVVSIVFLTIMKSQYEKNGGTHRHGYYMAFCIENLLYCTLISENKKHFINTCNESSINSFINSVPYMINTALITNNEILNDNYVGKNHKEYIKSLLELSKNINNSLMEVLKPIDLGNFDKNDRITRSDIMSYNFKNKKNLDKIKTLKKIDTILIDQYVKKKYGHIIKLALTSAWMIGNNGDKLLKNANGTSVYKSNDEYEKMSMAFAFMIKAIRDFSMVEEDIMNTTTDYSVNYMVNNGFQYTFELFYNNKQKFIEYCIKYNVYTNTVKEILDLLEKKLDQVVNESSPDLYTSKTIKSNNLS